MTLSGRLVTEAISSMFRPRCWWPGSRGFADGVELGEYLLLDVHPLEHGFDDQIAVGEGVEVGEPVRRLIRASVSAGTAVRERS